MKQIYIALEDGSVYGTNKETATSDIAVERKVSKDKAEKILEVSSIDKPVRLAHCDYWLEEPN